MANSRAEHGLSEKSEEGTPATVPQPIADAYFNGNENIIQDLLHDQVRYHAFPAFCCREPMRQAVWMRRTLINWLREVCEHRNTEPEVLAHTVQLIDRYASLVETDKRDYQLVGAACFFISSKLKETIPVSVDQIVRYTDFSITKQELFAKELLIVLTLRFDLTMITPIDFIQPLACFIPCGPELQQLIRGSTNKIFMKILHVEGVNLFLPAYVATACIIYAMHLTVEPEQHELPRLTLSRLQEMLHLDAFKLEEMYTFLRSLFKPGTIHLSNLVTSVDRGDGAHSPEYQNQNSGILVDSLPQLPVETSTPTGRLSSSFHSATSSSSTGLSVTQPFASITWGQNVTSASPSYIVTELDATSLNAFGYLVSGHEASAPNGSSNSRKHS
ncbi:G1:S specific cyclin D1 [Echinococcus multilocularis]|uniref:G1:S specific cyclin D1 n=2 Tax=Echinococcus multilocularis TaxID=6211 RepID=A0A068Y4X2_ECHMU|nr:G1:S specific cyclin D1 [Echinococcus multilocularis]